MTVQPGRGPGTAVTSAAYRLFSGKFSVFRFASIYAGAAILGTALFLFLHYLGNSIPYDLARQRFAAEFESNRPDEGHALGFKSRFEYCQISLAVMAGAKKSDGENSFVEAVGLKVFKSESPDPNYCGRLKAASSGVDLDKAGLKTPYWWGSKAFYAVALRHWSVFEIRELTRVSTYLAYGLLAASLLLLSPRVLLIAAPLIVFAAFFAGVRYWADVANGIPYLWAVLSAAVLALLMRARASRRASSETMRLYCFAAGMVSSYLWLGDGHTFLSITWIGLVVWFGLGDLDAPERTRRAVSCIVFYLVGFAICYALGLLIKSIFRSGVWWDFWSRVVVTFDRTVSQDRVQSLESSSSHFTKWQWGRMQPRVGS